jgi:ELP3 family radical SAM enzyme/protein acetyltransferase
MTSEIEDLVEISDNLTLSDIDRTKVINIVNEICSDNNINNIKTKKEFQQKLDKICRSYKITPKLMNILSIYRYLVQNKSLEYDRKIEQFMIRKVRKSLSGIISITVFTSPYPETSEGKIGFTCKYDCFYCPNEPGQPRSYLLNEPGVRRANNNKFDAVDQFHDRIITLFNMGHPIDKVELLILGGTFSSYPREYTTNFIRDQYYAANTTYDKLNSIELRMKKSIEEEHLINQNISLVKIIGQTIETRPDQLSNDELIYQRYLGTTRFQLGIQHIDNNILKLINRKCTNEQNIIGIKRAKEAGFKVDQHIMLDLPGSSLEIDRLMIKHIIESSQYQVDQWKIYPCEVVPFTKIKEWYEAGTYKPYAEITNPNGSKPLDELIIDTMTKIPPWIRVNRIVRDIPDEYHIGGIKNTSLRNDIDQLMKERDLKSMDIRSREIGSKEVNIDDFKLVVRKYKASDGIEYFISWENDNMDLLGFIRLRINSSLINEVFPELSNCALIRELHIYGKLIHHLDDNIGEGIQHIGLGKKLIAKAINITITHNINNLSVIAGIGVRNYYMKLGFKQINSYENKPTFGKFLILNITKEPDNIWIFTLIFISSLIFYIFIMLTILNI